MLGTLVYPWKLRKSQLSRHKAEKLRRTTDKWSEWEFGLYGLAPLSPPPLRLYIATGFPNKNRKVWNE